MAFKNSMEAMDNYGLEMNTRYLCILALMLFMLFSAHRSFGQSGSLISGGEILTDDFHVSFSAGQMLYTSVDHEEQYISLGLQHPNINKITNIPVNEETKPGISVLPNPARDKIFIHFENRESSEYIILMNSLNGNLIMKKIIFGNETEISLSGIHPGSYILLIYDDKRFLGSYNIIKI